MSASNWAICPVCRSRAEEGKRKQEADVAAAYGKLPVEEWEALREASRQPIDTERLRTFREDWELGINASGEQVFVIYDGGCATCGAGAALQTDIAIMVKGKPFVMPERRSE